MDEDKTAPLVSREKYNKLMDDYEETVYKLECLLCHATGNKFSKHTYSLSEMETAVDDYIDDLCNEAVRDLKDVKHGRWSHFLCYNTCSLCGGVYVHEYDDGAKIQDFAFCPFCGAKMDEEEQQ